MKKYEVELSITQTFTTKVVVEGDFKDDKDPAIIKKAEHKADTMNHEHWNYIETEFEADNIRNIPNNLSPYHYRLLECGYPLNKVIKYSNEDAESELDAIGISI
ncbi:hypothetical protein NSS71_08110 [Niallia sp. FSL W8-0951]|uniref:hypothetical protein n=1 Tax=Niallia sp. FSL W8-0951 TaxID=2954639 RepID=UPI0030F970E6